jgi:hypothetical protein
MEEAPENGKEPLHSAHATGMKKINVFHYRLIQKKILIRKDVL